MKKKIFRSIFFTTLLSVILFSVIVGCVALSDSRALVLCAVVFSATVICTVAYYVSKSLATSIVKPVKNLDLQGDSSEAGYKELVPIVNSMGRMSSRLDRYMDRLKNEKEKVMLITENMVEGMILLDEYNDIVSVNKSAIELLNPGFVLGEESSIYDLTDCQVLIDAVNTAEREEKAYGLVEINSHQLQFFINKASFNNTHGFMILLVDATEKIKAEEIRKDFSANVSHELKTPLTTIKGFGELLENGIITDEESVKKYGATIYRESERLLSLINDIMRLSEIEEQDKRDSMSEVYLLDTANDVCEVLEYKAQSHKITLSVSGDNVLVKANPNYMAELFVNLIDNAIKYNNEGGHVWVRVSRKNGLAYIVVKDDGIGIPAEHIDRIFERFYRVDKSRSKQTGGTGLGLSIVKHITTYHQGNISIKSEVNKGTEITVSISICGI